MGTELDGAGCDDEAPGAAGACAELPPAPVDFGALGMGALLARGRSGSGLDEVVDISQ